MRKAISIAVIGTLVVLSVFGACSSDKKTNAVKTQGDPNDQSYLQAQSLTKTFVDSVSVFAGDGYSYMSFDGTQPQKAAADTVDIHFDNSSFWWTVYARTDTTGLSFTFRDSIRFEEGESFQILPDSLTTTGLEYRASADFAVTGDSSSINAEFVKNLHATGIQSDQVIFNGNTTADMNIVITQSSFTRNFAGAMTDVIFNRIDLDGSGTAHPVAGALALAMNILTTTPQGSSSVSWTIDVTFFVDHYRIHFESGDNYWDWDGPYGG